MIPSTAAGASLKGRGRRASIKRFVPARQFMRYAIFSDIHANLRAWESVLEDIRAGQVDVLICLGDVVGYGPKPVEVLESIRSVTPNFVMGNHDAAAIGAMDYSVFNDHARHAVEWTAEALTDEAREFLASVPIAIEAGEILFVHAEVSEPGRFDYIIDQESARENFEAGEHFVTFVGHTHHPKVYEQTGQGMIEEHPAQDCTLKRSSRYIVNVGSVGEPRTAEDLRARYVIYDAEKRKVEFRAVEFDIAGYRRDLDQTRLEVTPFFLTVYEQDTALLAEDWMAQHGVVPATGGGWLDASATHATVRLDNLPSHRKSLWLHRVLPAAAAVLVVAVPVGWMMHRLRKSEVPPPVVAAVEEPGRISPVETAEPVVLVEKTPPKVEKVEPVPMPPVEKEKIAVVSKPETPEKPKAIPKPAPVLKPQPKPPVEKPAPGPVVAWWRMDAPGAALEDTRGRHSLRAAEQGTAIKPLAPNKMPVSGLANKGAMQLGVWSESEPSGEFALRSDRSFTWEAWVLSDHVKWPVFLAGTRSGEANGQQGWHVDLRPPSRNVRRGQMSFFWDSGDRMFQALSEDVTVTDLKPHHVAAVWDHDVSNGVGEMRLYLDGEVVASTRIHHSLISNSQANPYQIGAAGNPERLAMDEVRFSRAALDSLEFLGAEPQIMKSKGEWTEKAHWSAGAPPSGQQTAVVGRGIEAVSSRKAPSFAGDLVLREKASLKVTDEGVAVLPKAPGKLVLETGSRLIVTNNQKQGGRIGPIYLKGQAEIWGGISTQGHHAALVLAGEITGNHPLTLIGVNNNEFRLAATNPQLGGVFATSRQKQGFRVLADAPGCFGSGDVHIGPYASLIVGVEEAIDERSRLILEGAIDSRAKAKVILNANATVNGLQIDGKNRPAGTWGAPGSKARHQSKLFAGVGLLTVLK